MTEASAIRTNAMGLTYGLFAHGTNQTMIRTGKTKSIIVNESLEQVSQRWCNWQMRGQRIQDAFSTWSAGQREFIMTGITPDEWDEMFSYKEED